MLGIAVNNEIAIVLDHRARIRENNLNTLAVVSGVNTQGHPFGFCRKLSVDYSVADIRALSEGCGR